ncbi:MAG: sigma-70 family RNA polymerase sigma factor [Methylohalobius sp.]|nr:sigma-70 family RNA polymerase sigma factor [Methylohalobius sp.]
MLEHYLREIASIPLLSAEEEREIARRIHDYRRQYQALSAWIGANLSSNRVAALGGGRKEAVRFEGEADLQAVLKRIEQGWQQAVATLVKHNLRLVVQQAYRYRRQRDSLLLDLIQEGNLGLLYAARRFEVEQGVRFSTYAAYWIHVYIDRASLRLRHLVYYPLSLASQFRQGQQMNDHDITVSLQEFHSGEGSGWGESDEWSELDAGESLDFERRILLVEQALAALSRREVDVVRQRFGLSHNGEQTLQAIADRFGISRERVRQIEKSALSKMRRKLHQFGVDGVF